MTANEMSVVSLVLSRVVANWWMILLRGLAAIAFGIVCFALPAISLLALVFVWGAYALVDGIGAIIWGVRAHWWSMALVGAVSVAAGLVAFFWPGITALALLYLIAAWAVVRGVVEIAAAIHLRRRIENEWALALGGVLSIVFGALIAMFPGAGVLSVIWVLGLFSIAFGVAAMVLALRLRSMHRAMSAREEEVPVGVGTRDEHTH
jgi:uncharacterized membrane protein HdeD (DUF308 family)